jgi:hypothetical protein
MQKLRWTLGFETACILYQSGDLLVREVVGIDKVLHGVP